MPSQFYQGYMEAQEAQADLENKRALAQERIGVAKAQAQKLQRETAELDVMKQIFGNLPQAAQAMSEDNPMYIKQLEMAGQALMKVNPITGMQMLGKANAIKKGSLEERRVKMKEAEEEAAVMGQGLASIQDQDSYDLFMADLEARGKSIPRGLTGDYSRDKSRLDFYARSTLSRKDQINSDYKAVSAEVKLQDMARKAEKAEMNAELAQAQLGLAEQRIKLARERETRLAHDSDRNFARGEQKQVAKPLTRIDREQADLVLESREDVKLNPMLKKTISDTIASRAKKRAKGDPELYQDYLQEELDNMLESGELKIPKKEFMDPSTWMAKPEFKPRQEAKEESSMEGQTGVSKSGKPMIFRNGRWEYK